MDHASIQEAQDLSPSKTRIDRGPQIAELLDSSPRGNVGRELNRNLVQLSI